jgi:tRNA nucleotidyltransferase (CCA-adding enzyme)
VARRAQTYPQVMATAADVVDGPAVVVPARLAAADAMRLARRRNADVIGAGPGHWALREDAARADALRLGTLPIRRLTRPLPVVSARESEIVVRRHLADGAAAVVVGRGRTPLGVVRRVPPASTISMQARFERWLDPGNRELLGTVGRLAEDHGARAFVVGGLVRDAWLNRAGGGTDLDIVIEGDARAVARALAHVLTGTLVEHERFLTASVELPSGRRVDLVTARSERYDEPGALPHVMPAAIGQDLRRRDFTVNAMAVELASGTFGLLDPLGGVADVSHRRLRILHPLSFVEDPTRIFRAARYAARLGFTLDEWSVRCRALALELGPYAPLSPARIAAELERILADRTAGPALAALARAGVFRLLAPGHRATRAGVARLGALPATLEWAKGRRLAVARLELLGVALTADQPERNREAVLRGLGLSGTPLARCREALAATRTLAERFDAVPRPSQTAQALREAGPLAVAWLHLSGDDAIRERLARLIGIEPDTGPTLGGDAVLSLGVTRGPDVAAVLQALRDARLDGEVQDRQGEVDYVKAWLATRTKEG